VSSGFASRWARQPSGIRWSVLGDGAAIVLFGLASGLEIAVAIVRLARTQLFGVEPVDPVAIAGAMALLLVLAFAACFVPAHRASRIDPMTALRQD
jgi:ABC-type antimicrobial peptide transport system permease subunit